MVDSLVSESDFQPCSQGGCPPDVLSSEMKWFVLRVTYSRELKARKFFQDRGVECFVPMLVIKGKDKDESLPAVHNLIFVHSCRSFLDVFKRSMEFTCPLRYMIDCGTGNPMVVRDKEMEDFIRVTSEGAGSFKYLDAPSSVVAKGTPVEVVSGPLKGVQGRLIRIRRNRKVVLQVAGVVAIAVDGIPMEDCRIIEK